MSLRPGLKEIMQRRPPTRPSYRSTEPPIDLARLKAPTAQVP